MSRIQSESEKNKEGYNKIHDSITRAKNFAQLLTAIEASIKIIQDYKLDAYQQGRLEQYGVKKYDQLLIEQRRLESLAKHNKFKK